MSKIVILIPTLKSGGAEKQAALLAASLSELHEVHLLTFNCTANDSESNLKILPANVKRVIISGGVVKQFSSLKNYLRTAQIEIMFNYLTKPNVLGSLAAKLAGVKYIYNGIRNSRLPFIKMICEQFAHNYWATASIYNCYSGEKYFSTKGFKKSKNIVIPNCFPNINPAIERAVKDIKQIITVGRFVPQKDYLTAIKAVSRLKELRSDFKFIIVGYGEIESKIRNWIKDYNVEDVTDIYINPKNIPQLLSESDIYLSTSLFEGTSNSIMEALNASLPVVCTDVGDNSYLVKNNISGFIHTIKDYESISKSLSELIDSRSLRIDFGCTGNRILHENYSVETFKTKYLNIIHSL